MLGVEVGNQVRKYPCTTLEMISKIASLDNLCFQFPFNQIGDLYLISKQNGRFWSITYKNISYTRMFCIQ